MMHQLQFTLCLLLLMCGQLNAQQLQLIAPIPNTLYHAPQTTIILKQTTAKINHQAIQQWTNNLQIKGEKSGLHHFTTTLATDQQTIILKPNQPFALGEKVSVQLPYPIYDQKQTKQTRFSFTITTTTTSQKLIAQQQWQAQQQQEWAQFTATKTDTLPFDFPILKQTLTDQRQEGLTFFATRFGDFYLVVLDHDANVFRYKKPNGRAIDFKQQVNGQFTYFNVDERKYYVLDQQLEIVDSITAKNGLEEHTNDHDLQMNEQGHRLLIADDVQIVDMSQLIEGGQVNAVVIGNVIQEIDPAGNVVFEWRTWDHWDILEGLRINFSGPMIDYAHINSVGWDTDGHLLVSARHLDEVAKINRNTGELMWRLGGTHNEFTFLNEEQHFAGQHDFRRIENGNFTLFDNGLGKEHPKARAVEYQLDEVNKTATLVWQYEKEDQFIESRAMGSAQRLANGNTLIGWGLTLGVTAPLFTEVTPTGEVAFELVTSGLNPSYRVFKFPTNAFDLTAINQPLFTNADIQIQVFPNPTSDYIQIDLTSSPIQKNAQMSLYDVQGSVVEAPISIPNFYQYDCKHLANGIYYLKVQHEQQFTVKKIIINH